MLTNLFMKAKPNIVVK